MQVQTKGVTNDLGVFISGYVTFFFFFSLKNTGFRNMLRLSALLHALLPFSQSIVLFYKNEPKLQLLRKYQQVRVLCRSITDLWHLFVLACAKYFSTLT